MKLIKFQTGNNSKLKGMVVFAYRMTDYRSQKRELNRALREKEEEFGKK